MLTVVQSVYNRNPLISLSTQASMLSLDSLGIEYQYIMYNDAGDKDILDDLPSHIKEHANFEYHYSDFNYGYGTAPGGFVGVIDLIKYPYIHQSNQDDFYTPSFYSLSLKHLLSSDETVAAVCSNCYHVDEEFEISAIPLSLDEKQMNKAWSDPNYMFDWMFGINDKKLTRANNFIYNPGTVYKKELYSTIGKPDIPSFRGSMDFEFWARAVFNGYKFRYLALPTWSYMKSEFSHSAIEAKKEGGDDRHNIYNPRIMQKYQTLWQENNYRVRTSPKITENTYWENK
tara:strand:- start:3407 stop:4264 length:858 start_codon:yes stop_codon:yes gene_type:complete